MKPKNYAKGGSLKPVPPAKKGLAKLPTEIRNKMGYMTGGGKLGMKPNTTYATSKKYLTDDDFKGAEWLGTTRAEFEDASNKGKLKNMDPKTNKAYGKKVLTTKPLPSKGFTMSPAKKMAGGGKLDMMYQNGGKTPIVPEPKKKNVPGPKNKPTGTYFESKTGRVGRTYPLYKSAVELQSMDTTGYGAGRQNFQLDTSKPGLGKSSVPVKRKDVIKTIDKLKSGASRVAKFKNGGKSPIDPDPKRKLSPMAQKLERAQAAKTEKTFMSNARAQEARNLTEMRNALKPEGKEAVAKLDKEIKAKGFKVVQRPVKKMAQGGKLKPMHPTKDNNKFISNSVDMSPSTKKQMDALRQAMMYFTGVSPKNK